jgi:DegV family protein with EDD domain
MFEECFNKFASEGYKVIYIGISGAISSTFSYSKLAAKNINEKYNQKNIYTIDSRTGSYGTYVLIDKIKELIAENKSIDEIEKIIIQDTYKIKTAFISPDLKFLLKSGRISHITLGIGSLLKIVPTIYVGEDGKFVAKDKAIGKKLAIKKIKTNFINYINENNCTRCYFAHCAMEDEIEDIKQYIAENTKIKLEDMKTGLIDKTMSCGCGPKTVAAFCL